MLPILLGAALLGGALWKRRHGKMTPQRAAVHGWLMNYEHRPRELDIAAQVFGAEGLKEEAGQLAAKSVEIKQQAVEVPGLVERARLGDQNAMGMLAAITERAGQGDRRAGSCYRLVYDYCTANPPPELLQPTNPNGDPFGWPPPAARPSTPRPDERTGLQV